jgi:hypothetical protein
MMPTATMFKPPKGPKISRPQPTLAIGQPMPLMQPIPEPIDAIGRYTGIKHFSVGDGTAPEAVHITPTRPNDVGTGNAPGETGAAGGGTFMVGPTIAPNPVTQGMASGQVNGAPNGDAMQTGAGDPNQRLYDARTANIGAQRNLFNLQHQTQGPQQAVYDANGRVIQAQGQQNAATAQYQQQQNAEDDRRLREIQGINAAHVNGPDISRAAEAEGAYAAEDKQDRALGVAPPQTVQLPNGAPSVAGVRPKIMTQEAYLSDKAQSADAESNARLKLAQNVVSLMGTNLAAARQAAAEAGLTLEEANNMVSQARNAAGQAGLDVQQEQLGEPGKVLYTDPNSGQGEYVSQAEADQRRSEYQRQQALRQPGDVLYTDPNTGERSYLSQAEADRRKQDYQDAVAEGRIPQQVEQARRRRVAETQQSELGGMSINEALSMLQAYSTTNGAHYPAGFKERIKAEMLRNGWTEQAAEQELQDAVRPRGNATTITPPAFGTPAR